MSQVDDKYLELLRARYRAADKKERSAILDEFVRPPAITANTPLPFSTASETT